jgi:hypothetical protein
MPAGTGYGRGKGSNAGARDRNEYDLIAKLPGKRRAQNRGRKLTSEQKAYQYVREWMAGGARKRERGRSSR